MFRTKYEKVEEKFTEPGSPIKIVRAGKLDKNNNIVVVEKGRENLYAYINSFAESCDINVIMNRFLNGDKEVLLQRAGAYLDITSIPKSFQEIVEVKLNADNLFKTLPTDVKEKFGNNVNNFLSMMGSDEWKNIMNTSEAEIRKSKDKAARESTKIMQESIKPIENPAVDIPSEPVEPKGDIS